MSQEALQRNLFSFFLWFRLFQIDGVHESDRLERYSQIQRQVTVMLHECSIEDPIIK